MYFCIKYSVSCLLCPLFWFLLNRHSLPKVSVDMDGRGPLPVVQVTCKLDQIVNMLRNLVS